MMKPLRYNRRQVALMLTVATHFNPSFTKQAGESAACAALMVVGIMASTPAILKAFDLRLDWKRYVWNPR